MLLDKHERNYRRYLALTEEYNELLQAERNLPWVPVEKPYQDGWTINIELRDDIKRRADAPILQAALDVVAQKGRLRNPKYVTLVRRMSKLSDVLRYMSPPSQRSPLWKTWKSIGQAPSLRRIYQKEYDKLTPQLQALFYKVIDPRESHYRNTWYELGSPAYYLVVKVKPAIVTHVRDIDSAMMKRMAELRDMLHDKWGMYYSRRSGREKAEIDKHKMHHKRANTRALRSILKGEKEDFEPKIKHKL